MSVYAASRVRKKNNFKAEDARDAAEDASNVGKNADDVEEDDNGGISRMVERL